MARGRGFRIAISIGLVAALLSPAILAQQKEQKTPPTSSDKKKQSFVDVAYKGFHLVEGPPKRLYLQSPTFTCDDTVLSSDKVEWNGETKVAISPVPIKITNSDCDITGSKGTAYLNKRLGVVEGNVVMLLKPKSEDATKAATAGKDSVDKFKQATTINCDQMQYYYSKKLASATGNVVFTQPKRKVTADKAVYDQKQEILTLTGNVNGIDEDGQTFSTSKVRINLKKGSEEIIMEEGGAAKLRVNLDEETDEKP